MDKLKNIAQTVAKTMLKAVPKNIVIAIIAGLLIFILIVGSILVISLDDSKDDPENTNNASYVANQYTDNISIDLNSGEITSKYSIEELWKQMQESENRTLQYLNKPEQFKKLINAELVTKYPDTRANPDKEITKEEWQNMFENVKDKKIQGIIKIKRKDENGNEKTLTYVNPETFQGYIDDYNSSGSESAKTNALTHFTLDSVTTSSLPGQQAATITKGQSISLPSGLGSEYVFEGWDRSGVNFKDDWNKTTTQWALIKKVKEKYGNFTYDENGFGKINGRYVIACTTTYGNVGDYVDFYLSDGTVIPCIIGDAKNQKDAGCSTWGHSNGKNVIEFMVNPATWYNGHGEAAPGMSPTKFHPEWRGKTTVKAVNGGSFFDNPDFGLDNINETSSADNNSSGTESDNKSDTENPGLSDVNTVEVPTQTNYFVKVATWYEQTTKVESTDSDKESSNSSVYMMTTTNINYQEMVKTFQMPFEYLWSYMVLGKDYDLVSELADLVYNSKIEITVFDSLEDTTEKTINTYDKKTLHERDKTDANGNVVKDENGKIVKETYYSYDPYSVTTTVETKTNTIDAEVTLADVWFEKYSRKYTKKTEEIKATDPVTTTSPGTEEVINNKTTTQFLGGSKITYQENSPTIEEKVDKDAEKNGGEANFVSIFCKGKYYDDKKNILMDAPEWLFEMLKQNEETVDMVDLTKYFIYHITGDYKEFKNYKLSQYNPSEFTPINADTGGIGETSVAATGSRQQKLNQLFPNGIPKSSGQMQQYLKTISVPGINKSGEKVTLSVTVHKSVANDVLAVCQEAQASGFRIYSIGGYCWRGRNNRSATKKLSDHALGTAVDINTSENKSTRLNWGIYSPGSNQYSMPESGVVVQGFKKRGWTWGGNWRSYHDYMHFSFTGE